MTNWKNHYMVALHIIIVIGLFYITLTKAFDLSSKAYFLYIPIIFYYSLLPDLDHKQSLIRKITNITLALFIIVLIVMYFINNNQIYLYFIVGIAIIFILMYFLSHRGLMHTIIVGLIISIPLLFIGLTAFILGLIAYLSHLFIDNSFKLI